MSDYDQPADNSTDGFTFADNPYQTPLREWLRQTMLNDFKFEKEYRSDQDDKNGGVFFKWIQKNHKQLFEIWANSGTFSTCTSFVAILTTRILLAAGLADPQTGLPIAGQPRFKTFDLALNKKGWHPASDTSHTPDIGDIYALGVPGNVKHVGVILNSTGKVWQTVEAGQGVIKQYDSIRRKGWHTPPFTELMGWINIDEYFDTWKLVETKRRY